MKVTIPVFDGHVSGADLLSEKDEADAILQFLATKGSDFLAEYCAGATAFEPISQALLDQQPDRDFGVTIEVTLSMKLEETDLWRGQKPQNTSYEYVPG